MVKLVNYEDVPAMCDLILDEVGTAGVTYRVLKGGLPMVRIEPVNEANRPEVSAERQG